MDDERWSDEDRRFTGPEGAERGEEEDAPVSPPEHPVGVEGDDVTGEGLRRGGRLEDRLEQERLEVDRPDLAAVEEPEDVEQRRAERRRAGAPIDEGTVDGEKDQVSEEAGDASPSRSAEEEAIRVEEGDAPGGTEDEEGQDRYVEEP
jgi:hypothetical protein